MVYIKIYPIWLLFSFILFKYNSEYVTMPMNCKIFDICLDKAYDENNKLIILGDVNVDMLKIPKNHTLCNIINRFNFTNVISEPTRITPTSSTLIDPIFVSDTLKCSESSVIAVDRQISDHDATSLNFEIPVNITTVYKRKVWILKDTDYT